MTQTQQLLVERAAREVEEQAAAAAAAVPDYLRHPKPRPAPRGSTALPFRQPAPKER